MQRDVEILEKQFVDDKYEGSMIVTNATTIEKSQKAVWPVYKITNTSSTIIKLNCPWSLNMQMCLTSHQTQFDSGIKQFVLRFLKMRGYLKSHDGQFDDEQVTSDHEFSKAEDV